MKSYVELFRGELERLFLNPGLSELCEEYLRIDPVKLGLYDEVRSVFVRRLLTWCEKEKATEALVDAVLMVKKGQVDPNIKKMCEIRFPVADLDEGEVIDGFVIGEKIKDGGLGSVYRCKREGEEADEDHPGYGLKVVRAEHVLDQYACQRFKTLMRSMKADFGPSIQRVQTVGDLEDGRPYVVFEWTKGLSVSDFVPLSTLDALDMLESVMNVLDGVHERGFVHADINTGNIIVRSVPRDESGKQNVTLLGFGVDRLFHRPIAKSSRSQSYGQFNGISPEQAKGLEPTPRSDIYALGALLFELVSGKPPFEGKTPIEIVSAHLLNPVSLVSDQADDPAATVLDNIIEKCMSKEPRFRPANLDALRVMMDAARRSVEEITARTSIPGTLADIEKTADVFIEDPASEEAFEALRKETKQHNAWSALIELIEEAAITVDDEEVVRRLMLEAAHISVRNVRDYEKATQIHTQLIEANPGDPEILAAQRELMRAQGRYEDLVAELARLAELEENAESKMKLIREIGDVHCENLKDHSTAFDYYLACLSPMEIDSDFLKTIEKLAEKTERMEELAVKCGELAGLAEIAEDKDSAVFYYKKTGNYYFEQLDQSSYALSCYLKALEYKPADTSSLKAVADLYKSAAQWAELVEVLIHLSEAESSPTTSRDHKVEAAGILRDRLDNQERALEIFEAVIDEDPAHKKAVDVLYEIYENSESWKKLTDLLVGSIDALPEGREQVNALHRLGELFELHLDDLKSAKEYYTKALEADEHHQDTLKGLERIFARTSDASGLKSNLEIQLEIADTPKQQVALKERLALIHEEEFKDYDTAVGYLRSVLEIDAKHKSALSALTRLLRIKEDWEELVANLKLRAEDAEQDEKKELLTERATIIRDKIKDAKLAAEAFSEVASLGVDDALESMARAQEDAGEYEAAAATIKNMADDAEDLDAKIALMMRVAKIEIDELDRPADGVATLKSIQSIASDNRAVISELRRGLVIQGNYAAALDVLNEEVGMVESNSERAELIAQVGVICLDHIKDEDRAVERLEQALDLDPSNFTAGDRLAELYRKRNQWDKAMPIYQRWADASDALEPEKRLELFTQMAEAFDHLGKSEESVKTFQKAAELAGEDVDLIKRLGEVALKSENFQLAKEQFSIYMKRKGAELSNEDKVEVLIGLGRAAFGAGDTPEAAKSARQATVMIPDHRGAPLLLADVREKRRDFRALIDAITRVLSMIDEKDPEYITLLRRSAMVQFEKLRDSDNAARKLKKALEIDPENRVVLNDILKIYTATKQFTKVVETILHTASLVDDTQQLARYHLAVAKIYKHELRNPKKAIEYYENALEGDATLSKAEEAIVDILVETKDWVQLAAHYKKAIDKLPDDALAEEKIEIYKPLVDIVVNKLKNRHEGIIITEALAALEPDNMAWKEQLSELYGWEKEYVPAALKLHRSLLLQNPGRVDSFKKMFSIFSVTNEADKAWCTASLISLLNQGSPEELAYFRKYLPEDIPTISSCLEADQWQRELTHGDVNQTVSSIFSTILPAILSVKGRNVADFGLDSKDVVDVATDSSPFAGFVNFVSASLGVTPPPLYYQDAQRGVFELLDTNPPSLMADRSGSLLGDRKGISFALAQQLTLLRPGLFVHKLVKSGTELSAWLLASIKAFVPNLPVPGDMAGAVTERLEPMRSLDAHAQELLKGYVQSFVSQTADVNMKKWGRSVEYTMDRAGLLLCGDVSTAVRILKSQVSDKALLTERLKELTLFTISEEHFKLRAFLGTSLKGE